MKYVTLVPAYGSDYKNAKEVKAAWDAGRDFQITDMSHPSNGRYINKADAEKHAKGTTFNIRYKELRNIAQVKVK